MGRPRDGFRRDGADEPIGYLVPLARLSAVDSFDLLHMGMGLPQRGYQSVGTEGIVVADAGQAAQVAADGIVEATQGVVSGETLVNPVPDEAALQLRIFVDGVPIVGEAPDAVAHGMGVFGQDEGPLLRLAGIVGDVVGAGVHDGHDVGVPVLLSSFVDHGTIGVLAFHETVGTLHDDAVAALVAQRPADDGGVVLVALQHVVAAIDDRLAPVVVLSQTPLAIALGVALDVGLVPYQEADTVAEMVPIGVVWVMAGADGVDVVLFHQEGIATHLFAADIVARQRTVLVAIHTVDDNRTSVESQQPVGDVHVAEAHLGSKQLHHAILGIHELQRHAIQRGCLGRPRLHLPHPRLRGIKERVPVAVADAFAKGGHLPPLGVEEREDDGHLLRHLTRIVHHHVQPSRTPVGGVERTNDIVYSEPVTGTDNSP